MKNYWLDQKKKEYKGIQFLTLYGHTFAFEDSEWDCEKSNDTLQKLEVMFDFTIDLSLESPK